MSIPGLHRRFIRFDNKPQMWLWLSTDPARTPQKLLATGQPAGVDWSETTGKARITVPDERTRSGPGVIRTGRTADSGVVQLDIDGAVQNFTATRTRGRYRNLSGQVR